MTGPGPGGPPPFSPSELDGAVGATPEELPGVARVARDLEALADRTPVTTTPGFTDRVMGAIATEPAPAPARAAGRALRRGALGAFLLSIRDAWRVTFGSGFPMAARAQALALVLVFAVLAAGSGMVTAGALGLFGDAAPSTTPSLGVSPEPAAPSPDSSDQAASSPDGSPSPSASPSSSPDASPTGSEAPEPTEPEGTDDGAGSGGGDDRTPRPTETPDDDETPEPTETPDDDETPEPSRTPRPSETPHPTATPDPPPDDGD